MIKFLATLSLFALSLTISAQSWVQVDDIPNGRHHPITFALNGKGYAVTGTRPNVIATDDFFMYDPATDQWTTLIDYPGPDRSFGIGTTYNGKAYMGFGLNSTTLLNDLWMYDPNTDQWTQLASCPCSGRRHPAFVASNNKIYMGLGDNVSGDLSDWWMYDITTNQWTQLPDLPGPARHHPFHFEANGQVYAGMGHSGPAIYGDWYKMDTATNTWSTMAPFPGEHRVAGTQFSHNGYGYVLSGDGDNHSFMLTGEFWRYNPNNDTWLELDPHPGYSRWAPGSFVINDVVYFFGGLNRVTSQYPNDTWKYDINANTINIEEEKLASISVFPNPARDMITWEADESITGITIMNALGQIVLAADNTTKQLNISNWDAGLYLVQFMAGDELVKTEKLIVRN
jgi:N-acetylneuraminic acid mutarotase